MLACVGRAAAAAAAAAAQQAMQCVPMLSLRLDFAEHATTSVEGLGTLSSWRANRMSLDIDTYRQRQ